MIIVTFNATYLLLSITSALTANSSGLLVGGLPTCLSVNLAKLPFTPLLSALPLLTTIIKSPAVGSGEFKSVIIVGNFCFFFKTFF